MDKETLQKKIESGDTVWTTYFSFELSELNLKEDEETYWEIEDDYLFKCSKLPYLAILRIPIGDVFATKEEVEWYRKTTAERTERFEPPMWEEIEDKYEFYFTCQDYKSKSSNPCGMFVVNKKGTFKNYILVRNVSHYPNIFTFDVPATKENYEKACEIVRDLFKGESNGKNA